MRRTQRKINLIEKKRKDTLLNVDPLGYRPTKKRTIDERGINIEIMIWYLFISKNPTPQIV